MNTITITDLTLEELNLLLVALGKLPLETSFGLWAKVKTQAETQLKAAQDNVTQESK